MTLRFSFAVSLFLLAMSTGTAQAQALQAGQPPGNEWLFAVNDRGELLRFKAGNPRAILSRKKIGGLNEDVRGIDFRVSHGVLFVLGTSGRLYTLDTTTAQATAVGETPLALSAVETGFDFNPTVDRMRVALADGTNLRAHPVTGAQVDSDPKADGVQRDGPLVYAPGDPHAGWPALVNGVAYTYNPKNDKLTTNFAIDGARGILFNITGGGDLSLFEVNSAAAIIKESAHPEVNMIFGAQIDESLGDEVRVTVIATGFEQSRAARKMEQPSYRPMSNARPQMQQPQTPRQEQRPMQQYVSQEVETTPPPPAPQQPPAPQPRAPQPNENYGGRVYDEDNIDIPTFLRKRR